MQAVEIRLELLKIVAPAASRHGLVGDELIKTCTALESYVLGLPLTSGETPAPPPRKTLTRPVKDNQVPDFLSR